MEEKQIPACFANLTVEQMRRKFGYGEYGEPGTERHSFAFFWLSVKESEERDMREDSTLVIAKKANRLASEANTIARDEARSAARSARWAKYAAISAAIITTIAAREDIIWLISWVIKNY